MATITLNIPDAQLSRVVADVCQYYGYQSTINGQPNPETQGQFAKRMIIQNVMLVCQQAESATAEQTATQAVIQNITIT